MLKIFFFLHAPDNDMMQGSMCIQSGLSRHDLPHYKMMAVQYYSISN